VSAITLTDLINRLPARSRVRMVYEKMEKECGPILAVNVPWLPSPLWLVSGQREARALVREGIPRSHIWTHHEAQDLLGRCDTLHRAASLFQSPCPQ
jgi:hypothetical protein